VSTRITEIRATGTKARIMAHDEAQRAAGPTRLVHPQSGLMFSGGMTHPIIDADMITVALDGQIHAIGREKASTQYK
jgi:hypothetical protein